MAATTITRPRIYSHTLYWSIIDLNWVAGTQPGGGGGAGDASAANQLLGNASVASIDAKTPALGQALAALAVPVVLTALQQTALTPPAAITGFATETTLDTRLGSLTEVAPVNDTASSGLNGRLQRIAQRLTTLLVLPAALGANGGLKVEGIAGGVAQPVSAVSLPLPTGAATETTLDTRSGSLTEAAPANDTASSGLNGRLQRIAQRLTTLLAVFPVTIAVNSGLKDASTLRVVLATDQPALTNKILVTPDSVALPANQSVNCAQVSGTAVSVNSGVKDAGTQRVILATDQPALTTPMPVSGTVTVTPPTLTKGTQGATGFSTQDLKDAGRNVTNYFMAAGIAGTNAEAMQLLTGYKAGVAVAATATPAVVTAAKTYRITQITLSYQSLATAGGCLFRLRANLSGTGAVGSPLVMNFVIGSAAAVAGVTTTLDIPFPDGLEFAAGTGIAVGMLGISTVGAALAAGFGMITIYGYEY